MAEANAAGQSTRRVLVIALAEASPDLIERFVQAGELPNLKRLISQGARGRLESVVPTLTPQMWGAIVTGRSAGHHGLLDFWQRDQDGRFVETRGESLAQPAVWDILDAGGRKPAIINVPFTYPPSRINGFMISGEDAPGAARDIANPPELYDEVVRRFGRYRLKDIFPAGRQKSDYLTLVEEDVRAQTDVVSHLLAENEWDFSMVFYSATAITQHYFWADFESEDPTNPYRDVIPSAYRALDAAIGRLWDVAGDDCCVYVISECGAGRLRSGVHMNTVLERAGLLKRRSNREGLTTRRHAVSRLRKVAQHVIQTYLPSSVYRLANARLGWLKRILQNYVAASDIDWERTSAFSRGKESQVFVNLMGRDPSGTVEPGDDYEAVCDAVEKAFMELRDPESGEPAVHRVYRARELYEGPFLNQAPDLVIDWHDCAYMPTETDEGNENVFVERWREYMNWPTTGAHRKFGVLLAAGPGIAAGTSVNQVGALDLLPTWLKYLDVPAPPVLQGKPVGGLAP
jgi:predicted AlkP superfamily phosphohydrolase/phosphomutase